MTNASARRVQQKPAEEFLRVLSEPADHVPETKLFHRGDYRQPMQPVGPGALSVCGPESGRREFAAKSAELPTTGRRLAFARWLTGSDNPLTARVLANRVWMHHFGRGIVSTPGRFWAFGHAADSSCSARLAGRGATRLGLEPEAAASRDNAFNRLSAIVAARRGTNGHRRRQSVLRAAECRAARRRIAPRSGVWRRPACSIARNLDRPVAVKEDDSGQVVVAGDVHRRSIYLSQRRTQPVALMQAFDAPVMQTNCEVRPSSTVATQSLMLMNGEFWLTQATALADRALREPRKALPDRAGGRSATALGRATSGLAVRLWRL